MVALMAIMIGEGFNLGFEILFVVTPTPIISILRMRSLNVFSTTASFMAANPSNAIFPTQVVHDDPDLLLW